MLRRLLSLAALLVWLTPTPIALAAPVLRYQSDQRGGFVLIGNTQGYDCAPGVPAPVVGTVGHCGSNTVDSAADVFVRSEDPASGEALADISVTNDQARSAAVLSLPAGATVTYARLYWSAENTDARVDDGVLIEWDDPANGTHGKPPVGMLQVVADANWTQVMGTTHFYAASADVTDYVRSIGPGPFRVSGIDSIDLANLNDNSSYVVWAMVVLYRDPAMPMQNLTVFDGFDLVQNGNTYTGIINGFTVPQTGYNATLGIVAYEGDDSLTGDTFSFNGTPLTNALNPVNNFLNGTHSIDGNAVSQVGDLPQLSGTPGSVSGLDLDVVDITAQVAGGDTSATLRSSTTTDTYLFGVFTTAISTLYPDLSNLTKVMQNSVDVTTTRVGDHLHVTFVFTNTGTDTAVDVVLTDPLSQALAFIPGSLAITEGAEAGAKTDVSGDDQAEYDELTRTVTVRLGTGADAVHGGNVPVGAGLTAVAFDVAIVPPADANTYTISNQGFVSCRGQQSVATRPDPTTFASGVGGTDANTPAVIVVQTAADADNCPLGGPCPPMGGGACSRDSDCAEGVLCVSGACLAAPDLERLAGGSLGCASMGRRDAALWAGLLGAVWMWRAGRRRAALRRLALPLLLLAALTWPAKARARNEGFAVQRYVPSTVQDWTLRVERPWYNHRWQDVAVGLTLDYSRNPLLLVAVNPQNSIITDRGIIHHAFFGHLQVATSMYDRLTVLAEMPVLLAQSAQPFAGITPTAAVAFADPRIGARVRLFNHAESDALSVHLAGDLWIPVRGKSTVGDRSPRGLIRAVAAGIVHEHLVWAASVGMLARPTAELTSLTALQPQTAGAELQLGAAIGLTDAKRSWQVGPEINYDTTVNQGRAFSSQTSTVEALLSAQVALARTVRVSLGVGTALLREPGTPDLRAIARVAWQPAPVTGEPDTDADGVPDALDKCPVEPRGAMPDPNLLGCPARDSDKDGVYDAQDACPSTPAGEHPDPARPGCPVPDRDGDGILDTDDACPDVPGVPSPDPNRYGCPPPAALPPAPAERLVVPPIHFELNRARLLPESDAALNIALRALESRPEIRVSIEGHTDNTGAEDYNVDLSKRRAQSVLKWLVAHHVDSKRLTSDGFGPHRPVADNATLAGRRTNRRVEFVVRGDEATAPILH